MLQSRDFGVQQLIVRIEGSGALVERIDLVGHLRKLLVLLRRVRGDAVSGRGSGCRLIVAASKDIAERSVDGRAIGIVSAADAGERILDSSDSCVTVLSDLGQRILHCAIAEEAWTLAEIEQGIVISSCRRRLSTAGQSDGRNQ